AGRGHAGPHRAAARQGIRDARAGGPGANGEAVGGLGAAGCSARRGAGGSRRERRRCTGGEAGRVARGGRHGGVRSRPHRDARPVQRPRDRPRHRRGRVRCDRPASVHDDQYAELVRDRELPRDRAEGDPAGHGGRGVSDVRPQPAVCRYRALDRLRGVSGGRRRQRERPASRTALDQLGAGRAAFPRSYPHRRAAGGSLPHRRLRGRADTSPEQGAEGRSSAQREEPSMTAAAPALDLSGQRSASWPSLLREIFAPTPGRFNATIRIVVATAIVLATSMTLEVPSIALSLFIVIYLTKLTSGVTTQNSVVVAVAGAAAIVVLTLAVALTILIFRFTFDQPPLRLAAMALFFFLGM